MVVSPFCADLVTTLTAARRGEARSITWACMVDVLLARVRRARLPFPRMTGIAADPPHAVVEPVAETAARVTCTDPSDTAAALRAAWHGFATAPAAGRCLVQASFDDAVLARNAGPVVEAAAAPVRGRRPLDALSVRWLGCGIGCPLSWVAGGV
ncbi:MAG: hypothetical protein ACRDRH_27385 [Pseudonocardia sp.]